MKGRAYYPQAEPPEPVTCGVYIFVFVILLVIAAWVLLKVSGVV